MALQVSAQKVQSTHLDVTALAPYLQGNLAQVYQDALSRCDIQQDSSGPYVLKAKLSILNDTTTGSGSPLPSWAPIPIPIQLNMVFRGKRQVMIGVSFTILNQAGVEVGRTETSFLAKRAEFFGIVTGTTRAAIEVGLRSHLPVALAEVADELREMAESQDQVSADEEARVGSIGEISEDGLRMTILLKPAHKLKAGDSVTMKLGKGEFKDADGNLIISTWSTLATVSVLAVSGPVVVVQLPIKMELKPGDAIRLEANPRK